MGLEGGSRMRGWLLVVSLTLLLAVIAYRKYVSWRKSLIVYMDRPVGPPLLPHIKKPPIDLTQLDEAVARIKPILPKNKIGPKDVSPHQKP